MPPRLCLASCGLVFALASAGPRAQGAVRHWEVRTTLRVPRHGHGAATFKDRLYVLGGQSTTGQRLDTVEILSPKSTTVQMGIKLPRRISALQAASFDNDLWSIGGIENGRPIPYLYEFDRSRWKPGASMRTARARFAVVVYRDDPIVFGGWTAAGATKLVEWYEESVDRWHALPSMPAARHGHQAVLVGDKAYIMGGADQDGRPLRSTWIYDARAKSWAVCPSPNCDQIEDHIDGCAYRDADGTVVLLGGTGSGQMSWQGRAVELLDLRGSEPRWRAGTPLSSPVTEATATMLDGRSYLIGSGVFPNEQQPSGVVRRSKSIEIDTAKVSQGFPIETLMTHPPLAAGRRFPLVVFSHGLQDKAANYDQVAEQIAALGFLVARPQCDCFSPEQYGVLLVATADSVRKHALWGAHHDGRVVFGGFSAGGSGAILAGSRAPAEAVFGLAAWAGCSPPMIRCGAKSAVVQAAPRVRCPTLLIATEGDPLGTSANSRWIYDNLTAADRLRSLLIVRGNHHGGVGSGRGFADVGYTADQSGRLLQERTFRYVGAFLEAVILHGPADPVPLDYAATAAGLDVVVGAHSRNDPALVAAFFDFASPTLYIASTARSAVGAELTLGVLGHPSSALALLASLGTGDFQIDLLGRLLLDPMFMIVEPVWIPATGIASRQLAFPPMPVLPPLHFQGLGSSSTSVSGFAISRWRRSVKL